MKKGFTLIEILAVVTIIGLIFILVIPKIATSLKNKKGDVDTTTNNIVLAAAKSYVADNRDKFDKEESNTYCLPISTLTKKEYLESPVKNVTDDVDITNTKSVKITYNKGFKYEIVDKKECSAVYIPPCEQDYCDYNGNGYTEVDYIESTGTQYIDTGIKLNQNSRVKIKYQYSAGSSTARVFGDAHDISKGWILTTQDGTTNAKIQTLYGDTWKPQSNESQSIIPSTNIVEFERNGVNQYVNNNLYYTNPSSNFETTSTAIVFGAYYNSLSLSSIKLYELWIWEDGTNISRHFQPCYRKSDNKPGLYDTVTKEFYTNQGTGEFLYG